MLNQALLSLPFILTALAAPALEKRATVDCSPDSKTGLKSDCWAQLNMEKFINDWMTANGTEAGCDSIGFAQCFLQFNGFSGLTCDLITSNTCPPFPTVDADYYSDQEFYALWNIYSVYQFFNQYSQALSNGASLAATTIEDIVSTVAPPVEAQAHASIFNTILGGTISVLGSVAGVIPGAGGAAAKVLLSGLSQAFSAFSQLPDTLQATQTANDRFIQLGQIGSSLAQLVEDYQNNLLATVKTIQGNQTIFITACSTGGFSQRVTTSLTIESSQLFHQLQLFVLSQAFQANGIVSSRSTNVDVLEFAKQTAPDAISCDAFGPAGNCFQWWYDGPANNTYALHNPNDFENDQVSLTNAINDNNWATMSEVFKVENCAGKPPTFDPTSMNVDCIVNHGFCEYNYDTNIPQFKNCDNDPNWRAACGSFVSSVVVEQSYLGPLLLDANDFCRSQ